MFEDETEAQDHWNERNWAHDDSSVYKRPDMMRLLGDTAMSCPVCTSEGCFNAARSVQSVPLEKLDAAEACT